MTGPEALIVYLDTKVPGHERERVREALYQMKYVTAVMEHRRGKRGAAMHRKQLTALLFQQQGENKRWWIAQCLEHDIAVQADTMENAYYELDRVIAARIIIAQDLGLKDAFAGVPPAPAYLWLREKLEW